MDGESSNRESRERNRKIRTAKCPTDFLEKVGGDERIFGYVIVERSS